MADSLPPLRYPPEGEQAFHQALQPAAHQYLSTTTDHRFAARGDWRPSPAWIGHFTGGLNLHLTHHLFPGWHHRHYPALAQILARLATEHGMNYRCISYRELLRRQQTLLRRMGQPEEIA